MIRHNNRELLFTTWVFSLLLAACSAGTAANGPTEVHVVLTDFGVQVDRASLPAGPVKFVVENSGMMAHELVLESAGAVNQPLQDGSNVAKASDIPAGGRVTLEWVLDQPGTYQLACHVPGHYEAGMKTTFSVSG